VVIVKGGGTGLIGEGKQNTSGQTTMSPTLEIGQERIIKISKEKGKWGRRRRRSWGGVVRIPCGSSAANVNLWMLEERKRNNTKGKKETLRLKGENQKRGISVSKTCISRRHFHVGGTSGVPQGEGQLRPAFLWGLAGGFERLQTEKDGRKEYWARGGLPCLLVIHHLGSIRPEL